MRGALVAVALIFLMSRAPAVRGAALRRPGRLIANAASVTPEAASSCDGHRDHQPSSAYSRDTQSDTRLAVGGEGYVIAAAERGTIKAAHFGISGEPPSTPDAGQSTRARRGVRRPTDLFEQHD